VPVSRLEGVPNLLLAAPGFATPTQLKMAVTPPASPLACVRKTPKLPKLPFCRAHFDLFLFRSPGPVHPLRPLLLCLPHNSPLKPPYSGIHFPDHTSKCSKRGKAVFFYRSPGIEHLPSLLQLEDDLFLQSVSLLTPFLAVERHPTRRRTPLHRPPRPLASFRDLHSSLRNLA